MVHLYSLITATPIWVVNKTRIIKALLMVERMARENLHQVVNQLHQVVMDLLQEVTDPLLQEVTDPHQVATALHQEAVEDLPQVIMEDRTIRLIIIAVMVLQVIHPIPVHLVVLEMEAVAVEVEAVEDHLIPVQDSHVITDHMGLALLISFLKGRNVMLLLSLPSPRIHNITCGIATSALTSSLKDFMPYWTQTLLLFHKMIIPSSK